MRLMKALDTIKEEKLISFHMPGHKNGRLLFQEKKALLDYDITEIPGADHLHDAESCIRETEDAIADMYGANESRILVNGSTVGILSMILGATEPGDRVLVNRNAHKSVYNAIEMNGLIPVYIFPEIDNYLGIPMNLDEKLLDKMVENVKICILTYPTYEGLCYSIEAMVEKCHAFGIPVLVDEAHGAHLFLHEKGPKSSLMLGADIVVQSFHKTLPAMTQTACLHFSKTCLLSDWQRSRIDWYLKTLQSSSPSYVLMASIDQMLSIIADVGKLKSLELEEFIELFYVNIDPLKHIKAIRFTNMDITKIILEIPRDDYKRDVWDGTILARRLREEFGIQVEYDSNTMVLLMTSFCNEAQDFVSLTQALHSIDHELEMTKSSDENETRLGTVKTYEPLDYEKIYQVISSIDTVVMCAALAVKKPSKYRICNDCIGEVSAEYVIPYPPGIPILVPGEIIYEETVSLFPKEKKELRILV